MKLAAQVSSITLIIVVFFAVVLAVGGSYYFFVVAHNQPDETSQQDNTNEDEVLPESLEVEVIKPKRTIKNSFTEVTVIANQEITFDPHNRISTKYIGEEDGRHYYIVSVNNVPLAGAEVTLRGQNSEGETFQQFLEIEKVAYTIPSGMISISSWEDAEYILDASKLDVEVNRNSRLREDYEPDELVNLNKEYGIYTLNNAKLKADAAAALNSMLVDLRSQTGITDITVVSGYRSYETQIETYAYWVKSLGEQKANQISAKPGHSEHQLGTTVDFSTVALGYELTADFGDTRVGKWLKKNCETYGFQQFNDEDFSAEPWQFRWYGSLIQEVEANNE